MRGVCRRSPSVSPQLSLRIDWPGAVPQKRKRGGASPVGLRHQQLHASRAKAGPRCRQGTAREMDRGLDQLPSRWRPRPMMCVARPKTLGCVKGKKGLCAAVGRARRSVANSASEPLSLQPGKKKKNKRPPGTASINARLPAQPQPRSLGFSLSHHFPFPSPAGAENTPATLTPLPQRPPPAPPAKEANRLFASCGNSTLSKGSKRALAPPGPPPQKKPDGNSGRNPLVSTHAPPLIPVPQARRRRVQQGRGPNVFLCLMNFSLSLVTCVPVPAPGDDSAAF